MSNKAIIVYTDGACSKNPGGPGGWAATLNFDERYDILSGHEFSTTNNRMELMAVVASLTYLLDKGFKNIIINSDSAYVVNGVKMGRIYEWYRQGWQTKRGKEIANADLWKQLHEVLILGDVSIRFNKVPGHAGRTFNEIADEEAKKEVQYAKSFVSE